MSYMGIKNLKLIKNEEGKYNYICSAYDSSIRDYKGKRVWHDNVIVFKEYYDKDKLEWLMFKDILNGNIHGAGGKFSCLGWNSRKKQFILNEDEIRVLTSVEESTRNLRKQMYAKMNELNGIVHRGNMTQEQAQAEYEPFKEEICKYIDINENLYYNIWYKAWKRYLKESRGK